MMVMTMVAVVGMLMTQLLLPEKETLRWWKVRESGYRELLGDGGYGDDDDVLSLNILSVGGS